jgi:hypothetical protein
MLCLIVSLMNMNLLSLVMNIAYYSYTAFGILSFTVSRFSSRTRVLIYPSSEIASRSSLSWDNLNVFRGWSHVTVNKCIQGSVCQATILLSREHENRVCWLEVIQIELTSSECLCNDMTSYLLTQSHTFIFLSLLHVIRSYYYVSLSYLWRT